MHESFIDNNSEKMYENLVARMKEVFATMWNRIPQVYIDKQRPFIDEIFGDIDIMMRHHTGRSRADVDADGQDRNKVQLKQRVFNTFDQIHAHWAMKPEVEVEVKRERPKQGYKMDIIDFQERLQKVMDLHGLGLSPQ